MEHKDLASVACVLDGVNMHECKTCAQTCAGTMALNSLVLGYIKDCLSLQLSWLECVCFCMVCLMDS